MNNKGFTLIELLAIILILSIISSIGTYAVSSYIKNSRKKTDLILWDSIKVGAQEYIDECTSGVTSLSCDEVIISGNNKKSTITLGKLAEFNYLNTVSSKNSSTAIVLDAEQKDISDCNIDVIKKVDASTYVVTYDVSFSTLNSGDVCGSLKKHVEEG